MLFSKIRYLQNNLLTVLDGNIFAPLTSLAQLFAPVSFENLQDWQSNSRVIDSLPLVDIPLVTFYLMPSLDVLLVSCFASWLRC